MSKYAEPFQILRAKSLAWNYLVSIEQEMHQCGCIGIMYSMFECSMVLVNASSFYAYLCLYNEHWIELIHLIVTDLLCNEEGKGQLQPLFLRAVLALRGSKGGPQFCWIPKPTLGPLAYKDQNLHHTFSILLLQIYWLSQSECSNMHVCPSSWFELK